MRVVGMDVVGAGGMGGAKGAASLGKTGIIAVGGACLQRQADGEVMLGWAV